MYKKSMVNLLVSLVVGLGIAFSSAVWAKNPEKAVQKRDSNGDGKVSLDEWDKSKSIFNKIDLDGDGYLTVAEFAHKFGVPMSNQSDQNSVISAPMETDFQTDLMPIADLHFHPGGQSSSSPSEFLGLMNDTGVKWAGAGSAGGRGVSPNLWQEYSEQIGSRFIPFSGQKDFNIAYLRGGSSAMLNPNHPRVSNFMEQIEEDLETGVVKGVGEIFINNQHSNSKSKMRRKVEADATIFQDLYRLIAKHNAFLTFHMEGDYDSLEQMENLLSSDRNGRILWNHCGTNTSSNDVRGMLSRNSNLFCELSFRYLAKESSRDIFGEGWLDEGWRDLIEDFPKRFMIGTDAKNPSDYRKYIKVVRSGLLSNLTPSTARMVAYENAQRLFDLQ